MKIDLLWTAVIAIAAYEFGRQREEDDVAATNAARLKLNLGAPPPTQVQTPAAGAAVAVNPQGSSAFSA